MAKKRKSKPGTSAPKANKGMLGKVASTALDVASNLIPGGKLVKGVLGGLGKMFNHPEWWNKIPVSAVPQNVPYQAYTSVIPINRLGDPLQTRTAAVLRPFWMTHRVRGAKVGNVGSTVIHGSIAIPEAQIAKYVIPQIRDALRGIPLQSSTSYRDALHIIAALFAMYHNVNRLVFQMENVKPWMPQYTSGIGVMKPVNAARIYSLKQRLRETVATLRLPTTLAEVLRWRYGRCFAQSTSEKAPFATSDVLTVTNSIDSWEAYYTDLLTLLSGVNAQAVADLYTTYQDHAKPADVPNEEQYVFDYKWQSLSWNVVLSTTSILKKEDNGEKDKPKVFGIEEIGEDNNTVSVVFGPLETDTVALSSTVSTAFSTNPNNPGLFPVEAIRIAVYSTSLPTLFGQAIQFDHQENNVYWTDIKPTYQVFDGTFDVLGTARAFWALSLANGMELHNFISIVSLRPDTPSDVGVQMLGPWEIAKISKSTLEEYRDYQVANLVSDTRKVVSKASDPLEIKRLHDVVKQYDTEPGATQH